ncbi:hypothetical protein NK8_12380 [Caballeronia sp. NK8]|uniref:hypothetical protein n=1 Tax=Caballeronia sp. NK8 TaxID=140098 RepID=UPI001BB6B4CB|nr:hypothetical protein [Caballeronia sp. NK8]BCQ23113.1 hypothetical protein NK8_12380 [Caballeronia sp. NK8]
MTDAPFSNCQFRECDLPGQCRSEGKCHHPRAAGASEPIAWKTTHKAVCVPITEDQPVAEQWRENGYEVIPLARAAAGASEGQAHPIPVPIVIDRSHANQAYVTYGFRDEAMCTEFINATNSHRKPLYTRPSPEIAAQADEYKRMFEDAVRSLAAIDEALGIDPDDAGGSAPILDAIAALRERIAGMEKDAERLDWLREESCDLRCIDIPTGGGDSDVRWIVVQHHMSAPHEREITRSTTDEPRDAIDAARSINSVSAPT